MPGISADNLLYPGPVRGFQEPLFGVFIAFAGAPVGRLGNELISVPVAERVLQVVLKPAFLPKVGDGEPVQVPFPAFLQVQSRIFGDAVEIQLTQFMQGLQCFHLPRAVSKQILAVKIPQPGQPSHGPHVGDGAGLSADV